MTKTKGPYPPYGWYPPPVPPMPPPPTEEEIERARKHQQDVEERIKAGEKTSGRQNILIGGALATALAGAVPQVVQLLSAKTQKVEAETRLIEEESRSVSSVDLEKHLQEIEDKVDELGRICREVGDVNRSSSAAPEE